jgi:hypothetical protein
MERLIMKKHAFPLCLAFIVVAQLVLFLWRDASCAPELQRNPEEILIEGQDHAILQANFSQMEQGKATRPLNGEIAQALFRALPDSCKNACEEQVSRLGEGAAGTAGMTIDVIYVEARKEEGPIRALVTIACSSKDKAFAGAFREERLATLVINRGSSRLALMAEETAGEKRPGFVTIGVEKEIRINGRAVVGLDFVRSRSDASEGEAVGILKDERIQFYVFGEEGIKPAGSVLKGREERISSGDGRQTRSVYNAAVVFKKDMKGNIIGILSPFTFKKDDKRAAKGMVRYGWDDEKQAFVKE